MEIKRLRKLVKNHIVYKNIIIKNDNEVLVKREGTFYLNISDYEIYQEFKSIINFCKKENYEYDLLHNGYILITI